MNRTCNSLPSCLVFFKLSDKAANDSQSQYYMCYLLERFSLNTNFLRSILLRLVSEESFHQLEAGQCRRKSWANGSTRQNTNRCTQEEDELTLEKSLYAYGLSVTHDEGVLHLIRVAIRTPSHSPFPCL